VPVRVTALGGSSFSICPRPASRQRPAKRNRKQTRWTSQSRLEASNFPGEAGDGCSFRSLARVREGRRSGAVANDDGRKRRNEKEKRRRDPIGGRRKDCRLGGGEGEDRGPREGAEEEGGKSTRAGGRARGVPR